KRACALQQVLSTRFRSGEPDSRAESGIEQFRRVAFAVEVGSPPLWSFVCRPGNHYWSSYTRRCTQRDDGWSKGDNVGLRITSERHQAYKRDRLGDGKMDGGARI